MQQRQLQSTLPREWHVYFQTSTTSKLSLPHEKTKKDQCGRQEDRGNRTIYVHLTNTAKKASHECGVPRRARANPMISTFWSCKSQNFACVYIGLNDKTARQVAFRSSHVSPDRPIMIFIAATAAATAGSKKCAKKSRKKRFAD